MRCVNSCWQYMDEQQASNNGFNWTEDRSMLKYVPCVKKMLADGGLGKKEDIIASCKGNTGSTNGVAFDTETPGV
jgi:hypothetical protein